METGNAQIDDLMTALEALGKTTQLPLQGRIAAQEPAPKAGYRPDALIDIKVGTQKYRYAVEVKTTIDRLAPIGHLKAQLTQFGERGLLYAPYITAAVAKKCRELDIAFLDAVGNAHLNLPGLYIFTTGAKPHTQVHTHLEYRTIREYPTALDYPVLVTRTNTGTPTALRVIFALLCQPRLLNVPYREIKQAAGVALGAVGAVLEGLTERGHLVGGAKKRDRRLVDAARLFEEWVTNYPITLRPKLNTRFFRTEDREWWQRTNIEIPGAYWGGEVAAAQLTNYLKPANAAVYINANKNPRALTQLVANHRLRADLRGNIEVVDAFWDLPDTIDHPEIVPPILVYADLVATNNPRNLEAAKLIRERYIDHALRKP